MSSYLYIFSNYTFTILNLLYNDGKGVDIMDQIKLKNNQLLTLRKATIDDAADILDYLNTVGGESDNLLFGKNQIKLTIEQEQAFIENVNNTQNSIMLLGIIDNQIVSVSQINTVNRQRISHNCESAISVRKAYWGCGIGSANMERLIEFAKTCKSIKNINLAVKADNLPAIHLYKKYGFKQVGVHKNYFNINGNYFDEILMDLHL